MKNLKKKNNKGFSLVELIVVVMIMAILAVALAPQVMKWVGNSRVAADVNTYETMASSVGLALADETVYSACTGATDDTTITIKSSVAATGDPYTVIAGGASTEIAAKIIEILGTDYTKTKAKVSGKTYVITIPAGKATIVKTTAPDGSTVK
jgi:prepilin-type N-terminal cleavage/methylation domain-containing protein